MESRQARINRILIKRLGTDGVLSNADVLRGVFNTPGESMVDLGKGDMDVYPDHRWFDIDVSDPHKVAKGDEVTVEDVVYLVARVPPAKHGRVNLLLTVKSENPEGACWL